MCIKHTAYIYICPLSIELLLALQVVLLCLNYERFLLEDVLEGCLPLNLSVEIC